MSYIWTDSSIVLTWIQGPPNRWKTFVGNRVATIQEKTASASWRHVSSQSHSADLVSRGVEPTTLSTSTLWWKGPQWLIQEPSSWPTTGQYSNKTPGNEKCACCTSTNSRRHHTKIFKAKQTHQNCYLLHEDSKTTAGIPRPRKPSLCPHKTLTRLQKIHQQLQVFQGQANHHSVHTSP